MNSKIRATRESLLKNAQEFVSEQVHKDFQILAVYLCGSVLEEEYLLGGSTDIDLFFVRLGEPAARREFQRLTDEVHLDIAYLDQKDFRRARQLRVHTWLGPALKDARVLHDPQHFMDFTIAGVRGQFERADHIFTRASHPADQGRRLLAELQEKRAESNPANLLGYLRALSHTANSIAVLSGPPLTERRFLQQFAERATAVGRPGLYAGLLGLLGAFRLEPGWMEGWIEEWEAAFTAAGQGSQIAGNNWPIRLHPLRMPYYRGAFDGLLHRPRPENLLWPLLLTWTLAVNQLETGSVHYQAWEQALRRLELTGPAFSERLAALQAYRHTIEEVLEEWRRQNGVSE